MKFFASSVCLRASLGIFSVFFLSGWTFQQQSGPAGVTVERNGRIHSLSPGSNLEKYDVLFVGKGTKVLLSEGASRLWVGENTVLRIDQLKSNPAEDVVRLDTGKIRIQIKPEEAKRWKFETRSSVSGVRGTEFFISSTEATESLCVLEGAVESQLTNDQSETFLVPAGKGVQLREGHPVVMVDNSNFLVTQWVAETSLDDDQSYIPSAYSTNIRTRSWGQHVLTSLRADLFYCDLFNPDFDKSTSDSNRECTRSHLYPSLLVKAPVSWRLTPRLSLITANQETTFDTVPALNSRQQALMTVSEAYAQPGWGTGQAQVGFQKFNAADGLLLSEARFTNEPLTHLAARIEQKWQDQPVEFFLSQGLEGQRPTDGLFPHSLVFFRLGLFESRGQIYALRVDSVDPKDSLRSEIHQTNLGFLFSDRSKKFDYKISGIVQNGTLKSSATAPTISSTDKLLDLQSGYYATNRTRIFLRLLDAGVRFSSIAPAAYSLGLFPSFYQIGNITQARTGLDYRWDEARHVSLEYIASWDHERDGFVRWRSSSSNSSFIAEETNVTFKHQWSDYLSYQVGGYLLNPHNYSSGSDLAYGAQAWTIWSL
jgi:hypothetical protein